MALSEGPVTLADIMRVKGKKLDSSTLNTKQPSEQGSKDRRETAFLSIWEPVIGAGGAIYHPSIHHFCTLPEQPQLPVSMQLLSRKTHVQPGMVQVKPSQSDASMDIRLDIGRKTERRSFEDLDSQLVINVLRIGSTLPAKKRKTSVSQSRSRTISSSEGSASGSVDIVDIAKARLKKEQSREKLAAKKAEGSLSRVADGEGLGGKSVQSKERVKSREDQRSREGQRSRGGQRTSALSGVGVIEIGVKPSGEMKGGEGEIALTGTRMEVVKDPGRYVRM